MDNFLHRPLWFVLGVSLALVVLTAIGAGAAAAALFGDSWGAQIAKTVSISGGMAIAGLLLLRRLRVPPKNPR